MPLGLSQEDIEIALAYAHKNNRPDVAEAICIVLHDHLANARQHGHVPQFYAEAYRSAHAEDRRRASKG